MKRVAIVGADFAPSSLPPALRIRFFATHLREFGWEPIVITTDPRHYETALDPEIEALLPEGLRVIRTRAFSRRWARLVGIGDLGLRSLWQHWRVLRDLCRRGEVDLLFLSVPPYASMVLGRLIHDEFGVPYVIDYIDPWATDYYWNVPRSQRPPKWALAYAMARVLEPFATRHVAHITGVSRGTTDMVRSRYPWLSASDATEMPYGGETGDWEYICRHPRHNRIFDPSDRLLHVCSVGAYTEAMRPVLSAFFAAIRCARTADAAVLARLRLHFVGTNYSGGIPCVLAIAKEQGVADLVQEHPRRVPYLDALQLLSDAHGLLVIGSMEPHYTASKIFPYILSRKPLLTIFHEDSSVIRILQETGAGKMVTFDTQQSLEKKIEELAFRVRELVLLPSGYRPDTRWDGFEAYTTRAMTARLAAVFDEVLRRAPLQSDKRASVAYCSNAKVNHL